LRLFATPRIVALEGRALRNDALRRRHGMTDRELTSFLADLPVLLCLVPTSNRPQGKRSLEADLLSCAARSHADFIVTSLPLQATVAEQGGTQIIEADQLARLVGRGV
jgi:hypothetical protein